MEPAAALRVTPPTDIDTDFALDLRANFATARIGVAAVPGFARYGRFGCPAGPAAESSCPSRRRGRIRRRRSPGRAAASRPGRRS